MYILLVTQRLQLQVMLWLPRSKTVNVSVYDLYIRFMSRHWDLCHGVPLPFYKKKSNLETGENVSGHILRQSFFFHMCIIRVFFQNKSFRPKRFSLDTYVLGNQLKFSANASVEKFKHIQETGCDAPFLVFLPSFLPHTLSLCVYSLSPEFTLSYKKTLCS